VYIVIRKFNNIRSVKEAARRAESGIGQILKQSDGFRGYYVFGTGDGIAGSVTLFDSEDAATAANEKAMIWIRASLSDLIDGEPEVTAAEILATVMP
jgi:hypothetical protein